MRPPYDVELIDKGQKIGEGDALYYYGNLGYENRLLCGALLHHLFGISIATMRIPRQAFAT